MFRFVSVLESPAQWNQSYMFQVSDKTDEPRENPGLNRESRIDSQFSASKSKEQRRDRFKSTANDSHLAS